jgi:hypothetical protein
MRLGRSPGGRRVLFGEVPWGFRLSRDRSHLVENSREQTITAVVRHMRLRGFTLQKIVAELRRIGATGRLGRPIGLTRVFEIVHGGRRRRRIGGANLI